MYLLILSCTVPPIVGMCTYPIYWLYKKTSPLVNPFLKSVDIKSLPTFINVIISLLFCGVYFLFFGVLYLLGFLLSFYLLGEFVLPYFED